MVLAAGYGTRLKPLTDRVPKPLVPVAGKPMIQYALDKLQAYGIEEIVINVSHLKEQLTAWLAGLQKPDRQTVRGSRAARNRWRIEKGVAVARRRTCLCHQQRHHLDGRPAATRREPSGGEGALDRLARHWDDAKMDFLLLAQSKARAVGYDKGEDHLFIKRENTIDWNETDAPYIIAGIGIFHPRVLRDAPDGKFSVKILWHQALAQNRLFCLPHHGRWFQTGTLEDIKKAEEQLKASA